tara:strand:- start:12682 stop:14175 length:1494 start_codon:yes stop_codon:yes gene_type:complete
MSLKINILANYFSQIYVAVIGIAILPLYIKHMGAEAYGLVGFFTMLQAWFGILDMGLTPTISRETARYRAGLLSSLAFRQLFRGLSVVFVLIAFVGGGGLLASADVVATSWLKVEVLSINEIILVVQIMAISVALRWIGGLYRGVITGTERMVWLSGFNIILATLRFIAVFVSMWIYGFTPKVFFVHQLIVAFIEVAALFVMTHKLLPVHDKIMGPLGWSFKPVKQILKFSLTIAFTSSIWILVTQSDKFILSGILSLADYGYFTLAVLVASSILVISGPISTAILPRMAKLNAEGEGKELISIYRNATQLVSIIGGSAAVSIALCSETLLALWTGDLEMASKSSEVLMLYSIGNGLLIISAFPYYLQYAEGNLKYHLIGNVIMLLTLIPLSIFAALKFGAIGVGVVWLFINLILLLVWVPYVHSKVYLGSHIDWFVNDVLRIILPAAIVGMFFKSLGVNYFFDIVVLSSSVFLVALFSSGLFWKSINKNNWMKIWK